MNIERRLGCVFDISGKNLEDLIVNIKKEIEQHLESHHIKEMSKIWIDFDYHDEYDGHTGMFIFVETPETEFEEKLRLLKEQNEINYKEHQERYMLQQLKIKYEGK